MRSVADTSVLASLTERLELLLPEQPRRWGRMTSHQMAFHLAEVAESALGRHDFAVPARRPQPVIKVVALYLPLPWPRTIRNGADPAGEALSADAFLVDRGRAVATLAELAAAGPRGLVDRHPIFGPMSRADWHRWAYLHTDHHLRQFGL